MRTAKQRIYGGLVEACSGKHTCRACFCAVLSLVWVAVCVNAAKAQTSVAFERALSVIETLEQRFKVIQWKAHLIKARLSDGTDPNSMVQKPPVSIKSDVVFDAVTGRFNVEHREVNIWQKGAAPYIGLHEAFSFDGDAFRSWTRQKPGQQVPTRDDDAGTGMITQEETEHRGGSGFILDWGMSNGLVFMPPYFWDYDWPPQRLSSFLRKRQKEGFPVSVVEHDNGVWTISTSSKFGTRDALLRIWYDPSRGAVVGATWTRTDLNLVMEDVRIELQLVDDHFWLPRVLNDILPLEHPPGLTRVTYSDVKVNPPVTNATFRLEFPEGVYVDDYIENKSYVVGSGIENEQAAVRAFIERHGLRPREDIAQHSASMGRIVLIVVNALLLAGLLAYFALRWRRGGGVLIAALIVSPFSVNAAEPSSKGNWIVSHAEGERIVVSQCAFTVCVFTLECFDRDYNVRRVWAGLRPTKDGVLLCDLKQMLEAHDLEVVARQNVTVRGLAKTLEANNLAILPLKVANGENHYFVAMLDRNGQPVIVNVLYGVGPLSKGLTNKEMEPTQGLVLFVRSRQPAVAMSQRVKISPATVDLGAFPIAGPKARQKLPAGFSIENTTSAAIMVSSVGQSCGCTETDWKGGLIGPGQKQKVSFEVYPQAWGTGQQRKLLLLKFADGSERRVEIVGKGLTPQRIQKLNVSRKQVCIELTHALDDEQRIIEAQTTVTVNAGELDKLSAVSEESWLTCRIVPIDSGSARLHMQVEMNDDLIQHLADSSNRLTSRVFLFTRKDQEPVTVEVVIVRPVFFRLSHELVRIGQESDEVASVSILPRGSEQLEIKPVRLWSEPSGLKLDSRDSIDGHVTITIGTDVRTQPGFYVVKCELQSALQELATASFVVRVEKSAR